MPELNFGANLLALQSRWRAGVHQLFPVCMLYFNVAGIRFRGPFFARLNRTCRLFAMYR